MIDHQALEWLDCLQENNSRLTCWSLFLQPFNFIVCHQPGRDNGNADALSRAMSNQFAAKEGGRSVNFELWNQLVYCCFAHGYASLIFATCTSYHFLMIQLSPIYYSRKFTLYNYVTRTIAYVYVYILYSCIHH